jgi:hypothetical protein
MHLMLEKYWCGCPVLIQGRTWSNEPSLTCLAVGQARNLSLDRVLVRRAHDDWREWIYISIMDKLYASSRRHLLGRVLIHAVQVPSRRFQRSSHK